MRIAIVGGGPGGLFAGTLAKLHDPSRQVTVFERNRSDDTFGFGVVFSDATLEAIHAADPVVRTALAEHGVHWDAIEVRLHGEAHRCGGNGMAAISRRTLLALLQQRATDAGVDLCFSTTIDPGTILAAGYDLVVAADGARSRLREQHRDVYEPSVETATAKFIWLGTRYPFTGLTFVHERSPHGVFAVHGYPIGDGRATFIVETDEASWRAAGLDGFDTTQRPGPSDETSKAYLEELFARQVDGHPLLVNNSRWDNFRTVRVGRWHHRVGPTAVALLGDAAHTAHFSVGSGTKMAMEDAVALVDALDRQPGDVDGALAAYEEVRRPAVARIQDSARPSLSWWEHFGRSHDCLPPWQFAYHFFTRSLPESKLRRRDERFVDEVHAAWRRDHAAEPLLTPLRVEGATIDRRSVTVADGHVLAGDARLPVGDGPPALGGPWACPVEAPDREAGLSDALAAVAGAAAAGATMVVVGGGTSLTRRLLCEAARLEHAIVTVLLDDVDAEGAADAAVTAVLSGRTDLVGAR